MHTANLDDIKEFFKRRVAHLPFITVEAYYDRETAKQNGVDQDCDKIYIRPNGTSRRNELNAVIPVYEEVQPMTVVMMAYSATNDCESLTSFLSMIVDDIPGGIGSATVTAKDPDPESVYNKETGQQIQQCDFRIVSIDIDFACIESGCNTKNIEITC